MRLPTLAVLAALADPVAAQPPADLPTDLALVPADAVAFVHVRAADLWKNDLFAEIRKTVEKAGPKALAALDAQFVPKVSTLDRLTGFVLRDARKESVPFLALRFTQPFDRDAVVKAYLPNAKKVTVGGKEAFGSDGADLALAFPDDRHLVLGPSCGFEAYLTHPEAKAGPLAPGLKLAAAGRPLVAAVNLPAVPLDAMGGFRRQLPALPPEVLPLLRAEHLTLSLDLAAEAKVELSAGYMTADEAKAAAGAVKAVADHFRKELATRREQLEGKLFGAKGPRPAGDLPEALLSVFFLGAINTADEWLANPGKFVTRDGATLTARVPLPKELVAAAAPLAAAGVGLLVPAVQWVREAAARTQSLNNLKEIGLAIYHYHDVRNKLPKDVTDKDGKPLLSWRVLILPYLEQENVYKLFKRDEPWDSEHNKKASAFVIKAFLPPDVELPKFVPAGAPGVTHYRGFDGPGTVFERGKGPANLHNILDGTSNTILLAETAEAYPWAKPGDIPYDPKKPFPKIELPGRDVIIVCLGDATSRMVGLKGVSEKTRKAAMTHSAGDVLGNDW